MKEREYVAIHYDDELIRLMSFSIKGEEKRIKRAIIHRLQEHEAPVATVKELLSSHSISAREGVFFVKSEEVFYTTVKLPPLKGKELKKAVENEIKRISPLGEDFYFSYIPLNTKEEELNLYFVAAIGKSRVAELMKEAERLRISIKAVTWPEFSYQFLARSFGEEGRTKNFLFVHLRENTATIAVINEGNLLISRNFAVNLREAPEEVSREVDLEVLRAIQFFKQTTKKPSVDEAIIVAPARVASALKATISSSHAVPVIELEEKLYAASFQLPPLEEAEREEFLTGFADMLGACQIVLEKEAVNLLPEDYLYRRKLPRAVALFLLQAILFSGIFTAATFYVKRMEGEARRKLSSLQAEYKRIQLEAELIEKVRKTRLEFWRKYFALHLNTYKANVMARILRDFSENAPVNMVFDRVTFKDLGDRLGFEISGTIIGEYGKGNRIFLNYFNRMKSLYPGITFAPLVNVTEVDEQLSGNVPVPKVKFRIMGKVEVGREL